MLSNNILSHHCSLSFKTISPEPTSHKAILDLFLPGCLCLSIHTDCSDSFDYQSRAAIARIELGFSGAIKAKMSLSLEGKYLWLSVSNKTRHAMPMHAAVKAIANVAEGDALSQSYNSISTASCSWVATNV